MEFFPTIRNFISIDYNMPCNSDSNISKVAIIYKM